MSTKKLERSAAGTWLSRGRVVSSSGAVVEVDEKRILVGRSETCDLVIDDPRVSKFHLAFETSPEGVVVTDQDSTNGTYVGCSLRVQQVTLTEDTALTLGGPGGLTVRFLFDGIPRRVRQPPEATQFERLVGGSMPMRELYADLARFAPRRLHVLIEGETGTGKEEVARSIHAASPRSDAPFVVVDCGALASSLLESILFGHEKGAFSGATSRKIGLAEAADGGTLFLDELGELPAQAQTRLLRLLEARTIQRVGSTHGKKIDIRVVGATHRDLLKMINEGTFREDLYNRLNVARIVVPPLRERKDDIPLLIETLLDRLGFSPRPTVTQAALHVLCQRDYPGNVRELRNVLEYAQALGGEKIDVESVRRRAVYKRVAPPKSTSSIPVPHVDTILGGQFGPFRTQKALLVERFERAYLEYLYREYNGNITHAATAAGLSRNHLRDLLRKYNVVPVSITPQPVVVLTANNVVDDDESE